MTGMYKYVSGKQAVIRHLIQQFEKSWLGKAESSGSEGNIYIEPRWMPGSKLELDASSFEQIVTKHLLTRPNNLSPQDWQNKPPTSTSAARTCHTCQRSTTPSWRSQIVTDIFTQLRDIGTASPTTAISKIALHRLLKIAKDKGNNSVLVILFRISPYHRSCSSRHQQQAQIISHRQSDPDSSFTRTWDNREVAATWLPLTTTSAVSLGHHGQCTYLYLITTKAPPLASRDARQDTIDPLHTRVDNLLDTCLHEEAFVFHLNRFIGNLTLDSLGGTSTTPEPYSTSSLFHSVGSSAYDLAMKSARQEIHQVREIGAAEHASKADEYDEPEEQGDSD
ncbi:hypothetical protein F5883DRAFT_635050 [Diaporthe sp. PMI_573]|nr:hypothetical protein F5883DRAFT_635050 [Diaporthaceae sp. PMI_573]